MHPVLPDPTVSKFLALSATIPQPPPAAFDFGISVLTLRLEPCALSLLFSGLVSNDNENA